MRIGIGYDSHRLVPGRRLIIGGVEIPFEKGLLGHSDGDVLLHAIADSILGALGLGDIGKHFPDTDPKWKDASSIEILRQVVGIAKTGGFDISWLDSVIIAESPRLAPYMELMKDAISSSGIQRGLISIKAKTNEQMDAIGKGEGIAAYSVCLLAKSRAGELF